MPGSGTWIHRGRHLQILQSDRGPARPSRPGTTRQGGFLAREPARDRIESRLDPAQDNDLAVNESRWRLVPLDGGERTQVGYRSRIQTGWMIPGFVEQELARRSLRDHLEVFRGEVRSRSGTSAP